MVQIRVDDPADPRLADFIGLRDRELRTRANRQRPERGLFVAEGDVVITRALRAGYRLVSVLTDGTRAEALPFELPEDSTSFLAGPAVIKRITGMAVHRGSLGLFERRPEPSAGDVIDGARRVVVLEAVVNPINLGVMARSALGLGMDAMLLDPGCADPLYRRTSRVSMGEIFDLPTARIPRLPEGLEVLSARNFTTIALSPSAAAQPIDDIRFAADERVAILLGSEGPGLSDESMAAADVTARIPMSGSVDSLNVGAAAAVAFYVIGRR